MDVELLSDEQLLVEVKKAVLRHINEANEVRGFEVKEDLLLGKLFDELKRRQKENYRMTSN
jgi:hypothetical protein